MQEATLMASKDLVVDAMMSGLYSPPGMKD